MSDQPQLTRGQQMALALIKTDIDAPAVSMTSWIGMVVQALARREVEVQAVSRQARFRAEGAAHLCSIKALVVDGRPISPEDGTIGWETMVEQLARELELDRFTVELNDVLSPIEIVDYDMADDEALGKHIRPAFEVLLDYFDLEQKALPAQANASRRAQLRL